MTRLTFYGHACFGVMLPDGTRLCIDPYRAGGFEGRIALPPLPDIFDWVAASHAHDDHAAIDTLPAATEIHPGASGEGWSLEATLAAHDEHGGRLRGGMTRVFRLRTTDGVLVHAGDLGQRPYPALVDWLAQTPIDVLMLPVGGHFTLGGDGAAAWVAALAPRVAIPYHSADDGALLDQLAPRSHFLRRFAPPETLPWLELPLAATHEPSTAPRIVLLER